MINEESQIYRRGSGEIRSKQKFTPGSYVSRQAEWLTQVGLAGVEELSGAHVQKLGSGAGMQEVQSALAFAQRIGEETGITPEIRGLDLIELTRLSQLSRDRRGGKLLPDKVNYERVKLYEKIAQSAGALAIDESQLAS